MGPAVGQQRVEQRVVRAGLGVAEEQVVFRAELGGTDFVFGERTDAGAPDSFLTLDSRPSSFTSLPLTSSRSK
jgi:hypothetical protein